MTIMYTDTNIVCTYTLSTDSFLCKYFGYLGQLNYISFSGIQNQIFLQIIKKSTINSTVILTQFLNVTSLSLSYQS